MGVGRSVWVGDGGIDQGKFNPAPSQRWLAVGCMPLRESNGLQQATVRVTGVGEGSCKYR